LWHCLYFSLLALEGARKDVPLAINLNLVDEKPEERGVKLFWDCDRDVRILPLIWLLLQRWPLHHWPIAIGETEGNTVVLFDDMPGRSKSLIDSRNKAIQNDINEFSELLFLDCWDCFFIPIRLTTKAEENIIWAKFGENAFKLIWPGKEVPKHE
jgi:hypothetical protein